MSSSDATLPITEGGTLVSVGGMLPTRPEAIGASSPTSSKPEVFTRTWVLTYKDPKQEDRFVNFIHNKPVLVTFLMINTFTLLYAIRLALNGIEREGIGIVFSLIIIGTLACFENYVHWRARFRPEKDIFPFLKIERFIIVNLTNIGTVATVFLTYSHYESCDNGWVPVGTQPKVYTEAQCNYMSSFMLIGVGFLIVLRMVRLKIIMIACGIVMFCTMTFWMIPGFLPRRKAFQTIVYTNIFNFAGCVLICFMRHDQEKLQRRHFEAQEALIHSGQVLSATRVATLERFFAVLPRAISDRLRSGNWNKQQVDKATDASVLLTRVLDFETWSTSAVPLQIAVRVASMQSEVDRILRVQGLERVGRMGDTTLGVGNLLIPQGNVAHSAVKAARDILRLSDMGAGFPPLVCAVHMGPAEGVLRGAHYVRYEVRGEAVDAVICGVQFCRRNGRLVGSMEITEAATAQPEGWFVDSDPLEVQVESSTVVFRQLAPRAPSLSENSSAHISATLAIMDSAPLTIDDEAFLNGVSRMLGRGSSKGTGDSSMGGSTMDLMSSAGHSEVARQDDVSNEKTHDKSDPFAIITDQFGFFRFADDTVERKFHEKRQMLLPRQAAKAWLGYAGFVFVVLLLIIGDLEGPTIMWSVALNTIVALCSTCLALLPRWVSAAKMESMFYPWAVAGMVVPLLTVYGCALSRPSIVGMDIRAYLVFGAFVRSYCFDDARLQAIGVPLASLFGHLQYLIPGAHDSFLSLPTLWILIIGTVIAERNREGSQRESYRRGAIAKAVVTRIAEATRIQHGLMRSSMPQRVFDAAVAADFNGDRAVHQAHAAVMVVRAPYVATSGRAPSNLEKLLEQVAASMNLSTAGVIGDEAVVVGPVVTERVESHEHEQQERALFEALALALALTDSSSGSPLASSVLMDQDAVAHVVELGAVPNYSLLGTSATRLIAIASAVSGVVRGLLVSDRVHGSLKASHRLDNIETEAMAPMTVRGQGVLRWTRLKRRQ